MKNIGNRTRKTYTHGIAILMVFVMIVSMFSSLSFVENAIAHIEEGVGDPLQLYSYFDSDASTKITLGDSGIGRDSGNYDEWEGAYVRNITITNFAGDDRFCYLFFANDDSYLYMGLVFEAVTSGAANYVRIYFDEGAGTGGYDGTHDDALTANNENFVHRNRGGAPAEVDGFFNGASWTSEGSPDFTSDLAQGISYMNYEFKIPLDNGVDGPAGSDLNVASTDELGIFFEIRIENVGSGELHYWDLTGNDPTVVGNYADLRLGVQRKTATAYSTYANTGNPIIDGDITNDFAYANAFAKDITLTNFLGDTLRSTLYMCEDPTNDDIFIGMVVYISSSDSADFLRVYTDQDHNVGPPYGDKDGVLSDGGGQSTENYEQINGDNSYTEGFWDSNGAWTDDTAGADDIDGEGAVTFLNYAGTTYDRYEFEFRLPYSPASSFQIDGDHDLWITSPQLQGFLLEFYNSSGPAGERFFYWDLTTNLNSIKTMATAGGIYLSTGWAYLQTGGPALKPITPIHGALVFGTNYIFRVEAEDEDGYDGVNFVGFQVEGQTNWISLVRESTTNGIWYTYWDTTAFQDGVYNVTIVAQDNEGIVVKKEITVTISNGGIISSPPTIALTMPVKGSTISGTVEFQAATMGIASSVDFYVDNELTASMSNIAPNTWRTFLDTTYWNDGGHVISVIAKNAAGEGADAGTYMFDNWNLNLLDITQPISGSTVIGTIGVTGDFEADNSGDYAELLVDDVLMTFSETPQDIGGGDLGFMFNLDTTSLSEGSHQVKMIVYDPDGKQVMDMVTIIVDNLLPDTPTIASVFENQYIEGTFTFQVQSDGVDLEGVDLVIIYDSLTEVINITMGYNSASGYYEFTLNTMALQDGDYSVMAYARDLAGNIVSSSSVNFYIDNNAPILDVTYPMDNSIVSGDVDFNYSADDPFLKDVMYKIDGNSWMNINASWDTTTFVDGAHTVIIKATDYSGHETMVTLTLVVDNNIPTLNIINPLSHQFLEGDYIFKFMAHDEVGIENVRITITNTDTSFIIINDIPIGYNSATGYYEYSLDTTTLEDGNYSISAISHDISGQNSGTQTAEFQIDNNAPTLMIESPLAKELLTGSVDIVAQAHDVFLSSVVYNADGSGWVDISSAWDTAGVRDGTHILEIKAMDETGNYVIHAIEVWTDNSGPAIYVVTLPNNNTRVDGSFFVQLYVVDTIGVAEVSYTFGESEKVMLFENKATGFYEAEIITGSDGLDLNDGAHDLTITAMDTVGLSTQITRSLIVDNTGPEINIQSPTPSETASGDFEFFAIVDDDAGVENVYIRIDKGEWTEMKKEGDDSYTYTWNTRKVYNGKYDVDFKAMDALGNENIKSTTVKVDNFPMLAFIIFIIVLIIFLILMVVSWSKGPKPGYPATKEKELEMPKEEEEVPPPPEKATMVTLSDEEEIDEIIEELGEGESPGPPPRVEPSEELVEDETDKMAPPEPEEEY